MEATSPEQSETVSNLQKRKTSSIKKTETVQIVPEMKELMDEISKDAIYTKEEIKILDAYFNDFYKSINQKNHQYCLDDFGFVIRRDCHKGKKGIYNWKFVDGLPRAIISKVDLRKSKPDVRKKGSKYSKIYALFGMDLEEWLMSED